MKCANLMAKLADERRASSSGWSGGLGVEEEGKLSGLGTTAWFFLGMGGGQGVEAEFFGRRGRGGDELLDGV